MTLFRFHLPLQQALEHNSFLSSEKKLSKEMWNMPSNTWTKSLKVRMAISSQEEEAASEAESSSGLRKIETLCHC